VNLLWNIIVEESEIGDGESVDEFATLIGYGSWSDN
jgi:hypothetical protein